MGRRQAGVADGSGEHGDYADRVACCDRGVVRSVRGELSRVLRGASGTGDRFAGLYAPLHVKPGLVGSDVLVLLDGDRADAGAMFDEFVAALSAG